MITAVPADARLPGPPQLSVLVGARTLDAEEGTKAALPETDVVIACGATLKGLARFAGQLVAPDALNFLDDLVALSEKAPRFLSAREEERPEPELVAQPPRTDQIPIRD